ncbi:hypothetical protein FF1_022347 [Malus domestica]
MENSKLILHLCHIHKLSNLINRTHILIHLIAPALLFTIKPLSFSNTPKPKPQPYHGFLSSPRKSSLPSNGSSSNHFDGGVEYITASSSKQL